MWQTLRFASRSLARTPGITTVAILTLALGSGANTAVFSVLNAVLLRPLPLHEPQHLLFISRANPKQAAGGGIPFSLVAYDEMRERARSFAGITAFAPQGMTLSGSGNPERLNSAVVSADFFDVLGSPPLLGRGFRVEEGEPGSSPVAVISHELWYRRFGADSAVLGQTVMLDGVSHVVVGVMPPGFAFPVQPVDLWVTHLANFTGLQPDQIRNGGGFLTAIARLRPGVSTNEASAELATLYQGYREAHPGYPDADPDARMTGVPLQDSLVSGIRQTLFLLMGAVGFVLLIACANVAGLMLARASSRSREIAVRGALGASRGNVIRQLVTETLLLNLAGALCGVILARWGVAILSSAGSSIPAFQPIAVNYQVFAFTLGVTLLTGTVFGLLPALHASRPDLNQVLREGGRGSAGTPAAHRLRSLVVVSQMALSIVLLIGAGLLVASFRRVQSVNLGFEPARALTMQVSLPPARYPDDAGRARFVRDLLDRLRGVPGVESAAASFGIPLAVGAMAPVLAANTALVPVGERPLAVWSAVTPGYLKTLGISLIRGRDFTPQDDETAPRRVLISQSLARQFWPDEDPIGKHLLYARRGFDAEVVGVVGDAKTRGIELSPGLVFYTPYPQFAWPNLWLTIRARGRPADLLNASRAIVLAADPDLPVVNAQPLEDLVETVLAQRRQTMYLVAAFAVIALLLAMVGLYGVMAHSVVQRVPEFGIRQAIGAGRTEILRLVLRHGLRLSGVGAFIGIISAAGLARLMSAMLYQVSVLDPRTFLAIPILFLMVALAACAIPAWRAARVDPMVALRS